MSGAFGQFLRRERSRPSGFPPATPTAAPSALGGPPPRARCRTDPDSAPSLHYILRESELPERLRENCWNSPSFQKLREHSRHFPQSLRPHFRQIFRLSTAAVGSLPFSGAEAGAFFLLPPAARRRRRRRAALGPPALLTEQADQMGQGDEVFEPAEANQGHLDQRSAVIASFSAGSWSAREYRVRRGWHRGGALWPAGPVFRDAGSAR